jgi:hypothetical protein
MFGSVPDEIFWIFNSQGGICNAVRFPRAGIEVLNDWRKARCCSTAMCRDWMEGREDFGLEILVAPMQLQVAEMDSW